METKPTRLCGGCRAEVSRGEFSKTQMKKKVAKCKTCCNSGGNRGNNNDLSTTQCPSQLTDPSPLLLNPRPQRAVPGFEGLTVCRDWPQTKNGRPPNAQSLIYNPLLACALGQPIGGHCTQEQLDLAIQWWSLALPSWSKWIQSLQTILSNDLRQRLFQTAKGRPNALIPKSKGRGFVPHFNGRLQGDILEMAPTTALEVYACVTCLYSAAALEESEQQQEE